MKTYGETLRKIRKQKGFTMEQLANGIFSVSFLSKFERGESDISLSYFSLILEKLCLTFDEFFYIHNDFELDHLETFFNETDKAYSNRNLLQIQRLKKKKWKNGRNTNSSHSFVIN
ncbi:helix-turn-helix domain-containing protein [Heyndrickxia sp. NPDC080065]|uniref:helix-turn-helix domain-containing protein n=1 Tax=Heyndrickxia sp. NPDC080065 TaxID=3390568 RepID=UPI003D018251